MAAKLKSPRQAGKTSYADSNNNTIPGGSTSSNNVAAPLISLKSPRLALCMDTQVQDLSNGGVVVMKEKKDQQPISSNASEPVKKLPPLLNRIIRSPSVGNLPPLSTWPSETASKQQGNHIGIDRENSSSRSHSISSAGNPIPRGVLSSASSVTTSIDSTSTGSSDNSSTENSPERYSLIDGEDYNNKRNGTPPSNNNNSSSTRNNRMNSNRNQYLDDSLYSNNNSPPSSISVSSTSTRNSQSSFSPVTFNNSFNEDLSSIAATTKQRAIGMPRPQSRAAPGMREKRATSTISSIKSYTFYNPSTSHPGKEDILR